MEDRFSNSSIGMVELMHSENIQVDWLIKNLIGRDSLTMVYGDSEIGKSMILADMLSHVACGLPWCEYETVETKVGCFFLEIPKCHAKSRATGIVNHRIGNDQTILNKLEANFRCVYADDVSYLELNKENHRDIDDVIAFAKNNQLGYLVFDSLSCITSGMDENSPKDAGQLLATLKKIKQETGAAICIVHHTPKNNTKDARGSKKFKDDFQYRFVAYKQNDHTVFEMDKANFLKKTAKLDFYIHDNENEAWLSDSPVTYRKLSFDGELELIVQANPNGLSLSQLYELYKPYESGIQYDAFKQRVSRGLKDGKITSIKNDNSNYILVTPE